MVGLWEHSLGSAIISGAVSRKLGLSEPEEISTAALLHDIGKVLVRVSLSADYDQIIRIVEERGCSFREAEIAVLGVDHADIGSWLSEEWGLPERLIIPVSYHHEPERAPKFKERVAVVHIADSLVRAFGIGYGGDKWVGTISKEAWEFIGMPQLDLRQIMRKILDDLEEVDNFRL
jgi:putative nucleotidyltransferase with HDIG domain